MFCYKRRATMVSNMALSPRRSKQGSVNEKTLAIEAVGTLGELPVYIIPLVLHHMPTSAVMRIEQPARCCRKRLITRNNGCLS